jgi:flagellar biosynthesis chaperone FliJ
LVALLDITAIRQRYAEPYVQLKRQSEWVIELARLFEPCDKHGHVRTARQVKREVKQFLERLEQEAAEQPSEASIVACVVKAVRHRWWGLFTCYRVSNVPSSNNDLETFFKDMKHHQRRITGRKSVHEFILRYGPFAAFIDYAESFDDLLARLRQVKSNDFKQARQALRKIETHLKKLYRFRHHPNEYYRDLETRWARAISSGQ